jgi:hypothetical protein
VVDLRAGEMGGDDIFQIPPDCFNNSTEVYTEAEDAVMQMSPLALSRYGMHLDVGQVGPASCYEQQNESSCKADSPDCYWFCQPERVGKQQDCMCWAFSVGSGCSFQDVLI